MHEAMMPMTTLAVCMRRLADILPGHVRKLIELLCHLWDNEPCHARKEACQEDENEEDGEGTDANVKVFLDHSNERIEQISQQTGDEEGQKHLAHAVGDVEHGQDEQCAESPSRHFVECYFGFCHRFFLFSSLFNLFLKGGWQGFSVCHAALFFRLSYLLIVNGLQNSLQKLSF